MAQIVVPIDFASSSGRFIFELAVCFFYFETSTNKIWIILLYFVKIRCHFEREYGTKQEMKWKHQIPYWNKLCFGQQCVTIWRMAPADEQRLNSSFFFLQQTNIISHSLAPPRSCNLFDIQSAGKFLNVRWNKQKELMGVCYDFKVSWFFHDQMFAVHFS